MVETCTACELDFCRRPDKTAFGAQKAQRLFQKEKDNTHEEQLLLAQYALLHLARLLEKPDVSADAAATVSDWFQDSLKVWNIPRY